jgi:hypothetical protein
LSRTALADRLFQLRIFLSRFSITGANKRLQLQAALLK